MKNALYLALAILFAPPGLIFGFLVVVGERLNKHFRLALADYRQWRDFESKVNTGRSKR